MPEYPFYSGIALIGTDDGGIEHGIFIVQIINKPFEHPLPDVTSASTRMDHLEIPKLYWQILSRDPCEIPV